MLVAAADLSSNKELLSADNLEEVLGRVRAGELGRKEILDQQQHVSA